MKHIQKTSQIDTGRIFYNRILGWSGWKKSNFFILTILISCYFFLLCFASCSKPAAPKLPPPPVSVVKPLSCDVPLYYDYVGHMQAFITVEVKSQIAGTLSGMYFKEGDDVKAGDLLFVIDDRPYVAALAKAEAVLAQNLASLKYAKDTVNRYAKLVQQDYVAELNFDQYVTNVLVDEATIQQNKADVDAAKINLNYCTIQSPIDATTGDLKIYVGNYVGVGGDSPIITLNQITPITANFFVPEKDLPTIQRLHRQNPLKAQIYLYNDRTRPFLGELTLIDNQVNLNTGTVLLQATLPNKDKELWPGEFVVVRLILGEQKGALLLPSQAVQVGQNGHYIFIVKEDKTVKLRNVTLGQAQGDLVVIESGLAAGETVVLDGQVSLYPGITVTVKEGIAQ
jgi:multidrug efflux system membrane fusion protein